MIDIEIIIKIAQEASDISLKYYNSEFNIEIKQDESPVTCADIAVNNYINNELLKYYPNIPVISEENNPVENAKYINNNLFWLVDPIDGTQSFINKDDEFSICIALIENKVPIFGLIAVPVKNEIYFSDFEGKAYKITNFEKIKISCREKDNDLEAVISTRKTTKLKEYLEEHNIIKAVKVGSAIKFALIAEGKADIYPKIGTTMEWDTAAGQAILEAAGGSVTTFDGARLLYGKEDFKNPNFIALGKKL